MSHWNNHLKYTKNDCKDHCADSTFCKQWENTLQCKETLWSSSSLADYCQIQESTLQSVHNLFFCREQKILIGIAYYQISVITMFKDAIPLFDYDRSGHRLSSANLKVLLQQHQEEDRYNPPLMGSDHAVAALMTVWPLIGITFTLSSHILLVRDLLALNSQTCFICPCPSLAPWNHRHTIMGFP